MSKKIVEIWKSYIGKKVYVQTTDKGNNGRILGTLQFVDDSFIVIKTDNPSYYKETTTIAINKIEMLNVLSASYESHQAKARTRPRSSNLVQSGNQQQKLEQAA